MNRRAVIWIVSGILLMIILVALPRTKKRTELDWTPGYGINDKRPLGLYVFNKEAGGLFKDKKITRIKGSPYQYFFKLMGGEVDIPNTFVYIGDYPFWESESSNKLLNAVKAGMNGFISTNNLPLEWQEALELNMEQVTTSSEIEVSCGSGRFYPHTPEFNYHFNQAFDKDSLSCTVAGEITGSHNKKYANFLEVRYGKGTLLIHTNPCIFSNYYLLKGNTQDYAACILSRLPGKNVIWFTGQNDGGISNAPLSFILSKEALRNAFYFILIGVVLFILFNAKRKQRIIPVKVPVRNTTVDFVRTVGNLYYQEVDIPEILRMRLVFLREKLWTEYQISQDHKEEEAVERLSNKTGKPAELAGDLFRLMKEIEAGRAVDKNDLIKLDQLIHQLFIA